MKSGFPVYLTIGVVVLFVSAVAVRFLTVPVAKESLVVFESQSKLNENAPEGNVFEKENAPKAVSTSKSSISAGDSKEKISLVGIVDGHGSADYLDARDAADAIAKTGHEKLRWEIFKYDSKAIDQIIDSASKVSEKNLRLAKAIQIIPFADDACTLSTLSNVPRIGTSPSEVWTIRGRCLEDVGRRVALKISHKNHKMSAKVSTQGMAHYEVSYLTDEYLLVTEFDRSKLPQNK